MVSLTSGIEKTKPGNAEDGRAQVSANIRANGQAQRNNGSMQAQVAPKDMEYRLIRPVM